MKGDGNININIKFLNVGYNNFYQVNLKIIDENNNIIMKNVDINDPTKIYSKLDTLSSNINELI